MKSVTECNLKLIVRTFSYLCGTLKDNFATVIFPIQGTDDTEVKTVLVFEFRDKIPIRTCQHEFVENWLLHRHRR